MPKAQLGIEVPGMVKSFAVKPEKTIKTPKGEEVSVNELQIVITVNLNETSGKLLPDLFNLKDKPCTIDISPMQGTIL
jgi:hypothetical protein